MSVEWDKIIQDFNRNRCIIMLGPKLATVKYNGSWAPTEEVLSEHIADQLDLNNIDYHKEARKNLLYVSQRLISGQKLRSVELEDIAYDFLKAHTQQIPKEYLAIAELPVHCVINTTPDDFIVRAFREVGKRPVSHHYNFKRDIEDLDQDLYLDNIDKPIVYNLFGSLKDMESVVLTENHKLDFIKNVVQKNPPIPNSILRHFDKRKSYLFLGFNVENWQYRLLLDSLKLERENKAFSPSINPTPSVMTKTFYEERFGFNFIDDEVSQFIHALHNKVVIPKKSKVHKVFIAFSDKDLDALNELDKAFDPMEYRSEIELWHRNKLIPGDPVEERVKKEIEQADVILLMVSADFLAFDDHKAQLELKCALERRQKDKEILLIPVIVRHCDWQNYPGLQALSALPDDDNPIHSTNWKDKDEAYLQIVKQFRKRMGP